MRDHILRGAVVMGVVAGALGGGGLSAAAHAPARPVPQMVRLHHHGKHQAFARPAIMPPRHQRATRASTTGNLAYHGGSVQSAPSVFILFWGSWWRSSCSPSAGNGAADEEYLYSYFHALGGPGDGWSPISSQYSDKTGDVPAFPRPIWGGWAADCGDPPQSATAQQVSDEANAYARYLSAHGTAVGANTQIIVVSPSGTNPGGGFGTSYCAWHSSAATSSGASFSLINLPYLPDQGGNCGAGSVHGSLDAWSIVGGREFAESVTNPFGNGWSDSAGNQIGSKCDWVGLFTETMGGNSYAQQSLWDNHTGACKDTTTIRDTVTVGAIPTQTTAIGTPVSVQVKASSSKRFSLRYSATRLPSGLSVSATGMISGKPVWPGDFTVSAKVTDATSAVGHAVFSWRGLPPAAAIKSHLHPAHCVTDHLARLAKGTAVNMEGCTGTLAQRWAGWPNHSLHRYGGPAHINTARCVTIAGSKTANRTKINLAPCSGTWSQVWTYRRTSHEWVNPQTGKCLTDPAGKLANGTQLVLGTCTGTSAQEWTNV